MMSDGADDRHSQVSGGSPIPLDEKTTSFLAELFRKTVTLNSTNITDGGELPLAGVDELLHGHVAQALDKRTLHLQSN